jgi:hypothetical protein
MLACQRAQPPGSAAATVPIEHAHFQMLCDPDHGTIRIVAAPPTFAELAARVSFVGSSEHKRLPNPLAKPALRSDASDCDEVDPTLSNADPMYLRHLLQVAMMRGQVSGPREGAFPRYVHGWILLNGAERALFRGRLTNREQGIYKGYFETLDDLPDLLRPRLRDGGDWWTPIS